MNVLHVGFITIFLAVTVNVNAQLSDAEPALFTLASQSAGMGAGMKPTFGNPIWGDMNNDNFIDLIVPHHGSTPDIYMNNKNGTFSSRAVANTFGVEYFNEHHDFHGYSFTDYNNDNILDLFITMGAKQGDPTFSKRDLLYQGNGNGTFEMVSTIAGVENPTGRGRSSCWFDYDGDGKLDFLLKNIDTPNAFYLNSDAGTFTDIAASIGLDNILKGAVCALVDYDNDGLMDIFLTSEGAPNTLMRQLPDGGFVDVTAAANIEFNDWGRRGAAWGDYNNDGFIDLYIPVGAPSTYSGPMAGQPLDNILYTNNGDGTFTDTTIAAGVGGSFNTAAASWGDVNNDGDLDLLVVNAGEVDGSDNRNFLYINQGNGEFAETAVVSDIDGEDGLAEHRYTSLALGDYDNDGFLDAIIQSTDRGKHELYHNEGNANNYLKVVLKGVRGNAPAIGSVVSLTTTSTQVHQYTGAEGVRSSQSIQPIHFGVGKASEASINVLWPKGARVTNQMVSNLAINQTVVLKEGSSIVRGQSKSMNETGCYIWRNYQGWSMRCIGDPAQPVKFTGQINSNGVLTSVNGLHLQLNDVVTFDADTITFDLNVQQGDDTLNFTTTGDTVTFDIYQEGIRQPRSIRIGEYGVLPATLPVTLTE